jgi:hypothetical protein
MRTIMRRFFAASIQAVPAGCDRELRESLSNPWFYLEAFLPELPVLNNVPGDHGQRGGYCSATSSKYLRYPLFPSFFAMLMNLSFVMKPCR